MPCRHSWQPGRGSRFGRVMMVVGEDEMNARRVHDLLVEACRLLESAQDFAIAAYVGHAMTMVETRYGIFAPSLEGDPN